jgi:hypothetical protein
VRRFNIVVVNNPVDAVNRIIGNCIKQYGSNGMNALTNDTLNNLAATTTNTNVTVNDRTIEHDANGIVTVAANTPVVRTASPQL